MAHRIEERRGSVTHRLEPHRRQPQQYSVLVTSTHPGYQTRNNPIGLVELDGGAWCYQTAPTHVSTGAFASKEAAAAHAVKAWRSWIGF